MIIFILHVWLYFKFHMEVSISWEFVLVIPYVLTIFFFLVIIYSRPVNRVNTYDFANCLFLLSNGVRRSNPVTMYNPDGNKNSEDSPWSWLEILGCRNAGWSLGNRKPCRLWTNTRLNTRILCWTNCTWISNTPSWSATTISRWPVTIRPGVRIRSLKSRNRMARWKIFTYLKIAANARQDIAFGRDHVQLVNNRRGVFDATTSAISAFGVTKVRG